jgi:hypothetical protein
VAGDTLETATPARASAVWEDARARVEAELLTLTSAIEVTSFDVRERRPALVATLNDWRGLRFNTDGDPNGWRCLSLQSDGLPPEGPEAARGRGAIGDRVSKIADAVRCDFARYHTDSMSRAFCRPLSKVECSPKRDYLGDGDLRDAESVLTQLAGWFDDYNNGSF